MGSQSNKTASVMLHNNQSTSEPFFIVGIGASAGGLSAFESFFQAIPVNTTLKMAFVLIQHLSPDYKSILQEIIQRYTTMDVYEAEDNMKIEQNCIYITPANFDMALVDGVIKLIAPLAQKGHRLPIDYFFESLAKDKKRYAIGIILSGTAHDGSLGIQEIKNNGGIVIAQTPESCDFRGMPESAIATGTVDYILNPEEMANQLFCYIDNFSNNSIPNISIINDEDILTKIFLLLKNKTSHDFSLYKSSTVGRRIERRIAVHQLETLEEYYTYLQSNENEIDELFDDLLIGVTNFFRDPEAFEALRDKVIPELCASKSSDTTIRIWVAGCSTGEEAYSIAILFAEYMEKIKHHFSIQIFATDIDATAITTARAGVYPEAIKGNVSKERLEKYFVKNSGDVNYKIDKSIRDMLIFSIHDVIKDPPFSNLDLISCRNLLIYMTTQLQQKIIASFYYALKNEKFLFLGASETVGEVGLLFSSIEQKSKLFQCKKDISNPRQIIPNQFLPMESIGMYPKNLKVDTKAPFSLKEMTESTILKLIAPASVLVNEQGDILYLHGRSGIYLELPSGETNTNNILKMAREELQQDLIFGLYKAKKSKEIVHIQGLELKNNAQTYMVNLTICPVDITLSNKSKTSLYVVIFKDELQTQKADLITLDKTFDNATDKNKRIQMLKQELALQKEYLQDINMKLKLSNEELKTYNEEMQSMNEELQSTNEELETSKEELQSVNEELSTVNTELNTKIIDLSRINNDMNNLLAGTGIGTIFVDCKLSILRFTPAITKIINLILTDLGRPVAHISSNLIGYDSLVVDLQNVLDTLIPQEIEVQTIDKKWFLMRIQPYRTLENVIEGAVISFVNITEIVTMREELHNARMLFRLDTNSKKEIKEI